MSMLCPEEKRVSSTLLRSPQKDVAITMRGRCCFSSREGWKGKSCFEVLAGKGAHKKEEIVLFFFFLNDRIARSLHVYIIGMQDFELGSSIIPLSRVTAAKGLECGFLALFCACRTE